MSVQGTTIINPGDNYHFPRNKCSFGYVLNTNGTESGQCVIYPMGSGKIQKTLTPQQTFSWKNEEIDYIYNSGSIPLEIIFSDEQFELSRSQAFQQTDIGQSNTYMKDDKIPNPLNLDQYGNIGIGLPPFAINPTDRSWFLGTSDLPNRSWNLGSGDTPSRSWLLGTGDVPDRSWNLNSSDLPNRSWSLGSGDTPDRSWALEASDNPDISVNQSQTVYQNRNMGETEIYQSIGDFYNAGLLIYNSGSAAIKLKIKHLYVNISGSNDPANTYYFGSGISSTILPPAAGLQPPINGPDPLLNWVNNNSTANLLDLIDMVTAVTSNGARTYPSLFIKFDRELIIPGGYTWYISFGSTDTSQLFNSEWTLGFETNAAVNDTTGPINLFYLFNSSALTASGFSTGGNGIVIGK